MTNEQLTLLKAWMEGAHLQICYGAGQSWKDFPDAKYSSVPPQIGGPYQYRIKPTIAETLTSKELQDEIDRRYDSDKEFRRWIQNNYF
jgi:hypothetical protein